VHPGRSPEPFEFRFCYIDCGGVNGGCCLIFQHFDFASVSVSVALSLDMNHTSCVDLIILWVSVFSLHNPVVPSTVIQYFIGQSSSVSNGDETDLYQKTVRFILTVFLFLSELSSWCTPLGDRRNIHALIHAMSYSNTRITHKLDSEM
jgi:hypothetical protein